MAHQSMKLSMEKHKSLSNSIKSDVHTCQVHRDVGLDDDDDGRASNKTT